MGTETGNLELTYLDLHSSLISLGVDLFTFMLPVSCSRMGLMEQPKSTVTKQVWLYEPLRKQSFRRLWNRWLTKAGQVYCQIFLVKKEDESFAEPAYFE